MREVENCLQDLVGGIFEGEVVCQGMILWRGGKGYKGETHMGVVDGDVGMQGLHICVLQPLYLELVLHVGSVYRSPTELRSNQKIGTCPTQPLPSQSNTASASIPMISALWGLQPPLVQVSCSFSFLPLLHTCRKDADGNEQSKLSIIELQLIHGSGELEDGVDELHLQSWGGRREARHVALVEGTSFPPPTSQLREQLGTQ